MGRPRSHGGRAPVEPAPTHPSAARRLGRSVIRRLGPGLLLLAFLLPGWGGALAGGSFSVVPSFQTATYPWAAIPNGLRFEWPQSDQAESSYPWSSFIGRSFRELDIPFWEPHSFGGGYPFFSNGLSAVAYPPQVVLRTLFGGPQAHDLFVLGHLLAAGLGMFFLLRRVGLGRLPSLLSGAAWMLGSFPVAWAQLEMVTPVFALLPWGVYVMDRAVRDSMAWAIGAGWLLACMLLAGNLLFMWLSFLTCLAYGALLISVRLARRMRQGSSVRGPLMRYITAAAIGALGPAFVVLPTYSALSSAGRQPFTYQQLVDGLLMSERSLLGVFTPPPLPVSAASLYEMAWYGTPVAVLAVIGVVTSRGRLAWFARLLLVASVGVAVGTPLTWLAYHGVPGFDALQPYSRLLVLIGFALVILAGQGLESLTAWASSWGRGPHDARRRGASALLRSQTAVLLSVLIISINVVQQQGYAQRVNPPITENERYAQFPATAALQAVAVQQAGAAWPLRLLPVAGKRPDGTDTLTPLVGATALVPGIDSFGGYDSATPRRTSVMLRALGGEPVDSALGPSSAITHPVFSTATVNWALARRLGTDLVYLPPGELAGMAPDEAPPGLSDGWSKVYDGNDGRVYRVQGPAPGPYLVHSSVVAKGEAPALNAALAAERNPRASVVLEVGTPGPPPVFGPGIALPNDDVVAATRKGNNSVQAAVTSARPGWLVLPMNYDEGWSAEIDGVEVPVLRADYSRMAVAIAAGEANVSLNYRPPGLVIGASLTVIAIFLSFVLALFCKLRRRAGQGFGGG